MTDVRLEDVWRREAPHVLGALARRYGDFDLCEDAAQEAVLVASRQWPAEGVPDNPRGWLVRVAARRVVDAIRSERARTAREERVASWRPVDQVDAPEEDDTLHLLLLCGHPALTPTSQVALTLRAVGGLTTAQIAAAFLVPEATMAQRISRAKGRLRTAGATFGPPTAAELRGRLEAVLHVLHLAFTEGHTTSSGDQLVDVGLTAEAIRLTRDLRDRAPSHSEVGGLLALMLLTDARRAERVDQRGDLVPLEAQDRLRWDHRQIVEGVAILEAVLPVGPVGPFQLQAAIAAVHADAATWPDTDWRQVVELYGMLEQAAPGPVVTLNRAVAVAMADGAAAGLAIVESIADDPARRRHHRLHAVRGHLLEMAGRPAEAAEAFSTAARITASMAEQRYLNARAHAARSSP